MKRQTRLDLEQEARNLLVQHNLLKISVPIERLAKVLGAVVAYQPFEADDVSGLLYREDGQAPVIGVNSANSPVRQRFTIAHEIGHLRCHPGQDLILDRTVKVNWRNATSSAATDEQEMQANAYAAALLMPEPEVRQRLDSLITRSRVDDGVLVTKLAHDFRVSRSAMEFRLANLGLLTPA